MPSSKILKKSIENQITNDIIINKIKLEAGFLLFLIF